MCFLACVCFFALLAVSFFSNLKGCKTEKNTTMALVRDDAEIDLSSITDLDQQISSECCGCILFIVQC